MNLICGFGFMILFGLTNVFGESDQIELECPQGWFVQGQIVYSKTTNKEQDFAVCLACKINSVSQNEFINIEICLHNTDFFSTMAAITRTFSILNDRAVNSNSVAESFRAGQICGVNVKQRKISFSKAFRDAKPKNCTASANVVTGVKHQVDLICPSKSSFVEIKRINDTEFRNPKSVVCVVCQINLEKSKIVTLCPATLNNFEKDPFLFVREEKLLAIKVTNEMKGTWGC